MFKITDQNRETAHTITAWCMIVVGGFAALYAELFIDPVGEISGSVLGFTGECFSIAGGLLGIVNWVNGRLNKFESNNKEKSNGQD